MTEEFSMDMPEAAAKAEMIRAGFTTHDREPTPGTSFSHEVCVCWPPLADEFAPTPEQRAGGVGVLVVKAGTVDGRDVQTFLDNARRQTALNKAIEEAFPLG